MVNDSVEKHETALPSTVKLYPPLPTPTSIRLLNIEPSLDRKSPLICTFTILDLRHNGTGYTGYSALSYRWGDDEASQSMTVNDMQFPIRPNLYDFLILARGNGWTMNLWIDAVCINQDDIAERNAQVQLMGEIYSTAASVLVWLGKFLGKEMIALREMDEQFDEIARMRRNGWRTDHAWKKFSTDARSGLQSLIKNPYFKRKWIVQELILSGPNARLVCGIPIRKLGEYFETAQYVIPWEYRNDLADLSAFLGGRTDKHEMVMPTADLDYLIGVYGHYGCKDPKDHIYALLNLTSDARAVRVHYEMKTSRLYCEVIVYLAKKRRFPSAQGLHDFQGLLQHVMGLSIEEVGLSWNELMQEQNLDDVWDLQYAEAFRKCLGHFCLADKTKAGEVAQSEDTSDSSIRLDELSVFSSDYIDFVPSKASNNRPIPILPMSESLRAFRQHVETHQLSTQSSHQFLGLGNYIVGVATDECVPLDEGSSPQHQAYATGASVISFPPSKASPLSCFFWNINLPFSDFPLLLQSATAIGSETKRKKLIPLAKGDVLCQFSSHEAALLIRRLSASRAICGTAVVEFSSLSFPAFRKMVAKMLQAVKRGMNSSASSGRTLSFVNDFKTAGKIKIYMCPHSFLGIQNWSINTGLPFTSSRFRCYCRNDSRSCTQSRFVMRSLEEYLEENDGT